MPGLFRHPPLVQQTDPVVVTGSAPIVPTGWIPNGPDPQHLWWSNYRRPADFQQPVLPNVIKLAPDQYISVRAVPSIRQVGIPTLTGGAGAFICLLSGVDVTGNTQLLGASDTGALNSVGAAQLITIASQTLGRWTAHVDFYDATGTFAPAVGQTIQFVESGLKLFGGCIQQIVVEPLLPLLSTDAQARLIYHVTATDKSGIADHRIITGKTYFALDPVSGAATTVQSVILDIVKNYLNGEGITTTAQSVPALGNLAADMVFNFPTVASAFDQIATLTGAVWGVDQDGTLYFNSVSSLPAAPFSLTATSNNFRAITVTKTTLNYRNVQYVVSNLTVLPQGGGSGVGTTTETYTFTAGQPGVQLDGFGNAARVSLNLPVGTLYSVTINGHVQTIVSFDAWAGQQPNIPGFDYLVFWLTGQNVITPSGYLSIPVGATIVVNYTPASTSTAATFGTALAPVSPVSGNPLGTCGSGIYEVVAQVHDVSTTVSLNAIAAAELAKSGGIPTIIDFETDQPGLRTGQLLTVNIPLLKVNANFMIISVTGVRQSGVLPDYACGFRWVVKAQSNEDPGNWIQWFARGLDRSANPVPVPQYEVAEFVLAPGGSLAGGTVLTNPYIVKRTGLLFDAGSAFTKPPTNENLTLTPYVNAVAVPGCSITIAGGSVASTLVKYVFPKVTPLYVFAGQIVTLKAAYTSTGANPLPAANGTFYLRWTM